MSCARFGARNVGREVLADGQRAATYIRSHLRRDRVSENDVGGRISVHLTWSGTRCSIPNMELSSVKMRRMELSRVHAQRLQFAQQEQSEHVVDVGIEQNGSADRRLPQAMRAG